MLKDVESADSMLSLEEEYSYIMRVRKKEGENGMGNLPLYYTVLTDKIILLFRSPVQRLIFA